MINNCGREAANVSTSVGRRTQALTCPILLVRPWSASEHSFFGYFENYFLLSPNGQLANSLSPRSAASPLSKFGPAVVLGSLIAFPKAPCTPCRQLPRNELSILAKARERSTLVSEVCLTLLLMFETADRANTFSMR
jgi:hypothetical protein